MQNHPLIDNALARCTAPFSMESNYQQGCQLVHARQQQPTGEKENVQMSIYNGQKTKHARIARSLN